MKLFLQNYVLIQDAAVIKYASILKRLEVINGDFEVHSLEKKIFGRYAK